MPKARVPAERLHRLRNEIPVTALLADVLGVATKISEGYFRFLCPVCNEFNTATSPDTNLARCFRCERNFNTIDLVMIVERANFLDAVQRLTEFLRN